MEGAGVNTGHTEEGADRCKWIHSQNLTPCQAHKHVATKLVVRAISKNDQPFVALAGTDERFSPPQETRCTR